VLIISLSLFSPLPIYRQIVQQVRRAIVQSQLQIGEQLPPVRTLAATLDVNPNTVARAYRELIRDGVVESRAGIGVFIVERVRQTLLPDEREQRLSHVVEQVLFEALLLDFSLPEVRTAFEVQWKKHYHNFSGEK
jgi:GntR family transcriptional regulator